MMSSSAVLGIEPGLSYAKPLNYIFGITVGVFKGPFPFLPKIGIGIVICNV